MFPQTTTTQTIQDTTTNNVISDGEKVYKTPNYDFDDFQTVLINGDAELVDDYRSVRNWIMKFLNTPIDIKEIYEGTGFGTSLYKLNSCNILQIFQRKKNLLKYCRRIMTFRKLSLKMRCS